MWLRSMLIDNAKAAIPFFDTIRAIKRRLVPYIDNPANSQLALEQGLMQIVMLRDAGARLDGDVLEIGTGWLPIIPLLFHVAGARHTTLTDIDRLMDDATMARAHAIVAGQAVAVGASLGLAAEDVAARLDRPWAHSYLTPWDIAGQPRGSADIVVSRAVLEHIDPDTLSRYFRALLDIVRPGGVMCHVIDNSDHWEHRDKSISRLNFLQYDDGPFWRFVGCNGQNYQNRLRHSDYLALFRATGWEVVDAAGEPDAPSLRAIVGLALAARFRGYAHEDLAILTSSIVVRRPA